VDISDKADPKKSRVNIRKFQDFVPVISADIDPLSDSVNGHLEKKRKAVGGGHSVSEHVDPL